MAMSDKFKRVKPDITPYLFHFTKGRDAKEILAKILREEKLVSSSHDYICFSASPLTSLFEFFNTKIMRTGEPMYQPFGIGFSRNVMYEKYGARNVIYDTKETLTAIEQNNPELTWRLEELDINSHDFEYLREWRIKGREFNFKEFDKNEMIIVADNKKTLIDLISQIDIDVDFEEFEPGECFPYIVQSRKRAFKVFSIEEAAQFSNDYQIACATKTQAIDEELKKSL